MKDNNIDILKFLDAIKNVHSEIGKQLNSSIEILDDFHNSVLVENNDIKKTTKVIDQIKEKFSIL
jgi:hypothetical protein